jgi:putative DNA primase/helicase
MTASSRPPQARQPGGRVDLDLVEAAFAVGAGLPVAELAVPGDPATGRAAAAALWMARLWGDRDGHACLGVGVDGHLTPGGGYQFGRFTQSFHRWPAGRDRLLAQAMAAADQADVYVGVLLRSGPSRRAGTAQAGRVAWADVDGAWTTQRARALGRLGGWPTWQVQSGSGRHLYLPLDDLEEPERLEGWNRRLAILLAADSGWSASKLLRLPGTFNHKPRAAGGRSVPVTWLW